MYSIQEKVYAPHILIYPDKIETRYDTPEYTAQTFLRAMFQGDYNLWLTSWDKKSQKMRIERDKKMGRDPAFWISIWKKNMDGASSMLVKRADYDDYILISYQLKNSAGETTFSSPIVLKMVSDMTWKVTNDLMESPVVHNWPEALPNKQWKTTKN